MSQRSYDGPAIDASYQYITERPSLDDSADTVYATAPEPDGEETTEDVPVPDGGRPEEDVDGQTTLDDWGWST
ncbi:hypothetical protein [Halorussus halobius]|uniref:hypothetical protein n=1 Tax=Halorussus halobius TaxID=1710537 RepID=UPI0010929405|nr:hypothetical protein [Halorussus halobius]